MRAPLLALLLTACGAAEEASDGWAELGQTGAGYVGVCAPPTLLRQPRERLAADTCWRVDVGEGFGLTEADGPRDCETAPRCLVTRSTAVKRQLLDWTAEGEDSPYTWREVRCDDDCR